MKRLRLNLRELPLDKLKQLRIVQYDARLDIGGARLLGKQPCRLVEPFGMRREAGADFGLLHGRDCGTSAWRRRRFPSDSSASWRCRDSCRRSSGEASRARSSIEPMQALLRVDFQFRPWRDRAPSGARPAAGSHSASARSSSSAALRAVAGSRACRTWMPSSCSTCGSAPRRITTIGRPSHDQRHGVALAGARERAKASSSITSTAASATRWRCSAGTAASSCSRNAPLRRDPSAAAPHRRRGRRRARRIDAGRLAQSVGHHAGAPGRCERLAIGMQRLQREQRMVGQRRERAAQCFGHVAEPRRRSERRTARAASTFAWARAAMVSSAESKAARCAAGSSARTARNSASRWLRIAGLTRSS